MKILNWITTKLLRLYKPGYLPEPIFFEMCRLNTLIAVEILVKDGDRIYLEERDDKYFGSVLHIPGTIVRGNESVDDAYYRLRNELLGERIQIIEQVNYDKVCFKETPRGNVLHFLKIVDTGLDTNYSIKRLPKNTLNYHRAVLKDL